MINDAVTYEEGIHSRCGVFETSKCHTTDKLLTCRQDTKSIASFIQELAVVLLLTPYKIETIIPAMHLSTGQSYHHKKLADWEDLGWDFIKHYDSGSDDEKALGRARRLATAEVKRTSAVAATPTNK